MIKIIYTRKQLFLELMQTIRMNNRIVTRWTVILFLLYHGQSVAETTTYLKLFLKPIAKFRTNVYGKLLLKMWEFKFKDCISKEKEMCNSMFNSKHDSFSAKQLLPQMYRKIVNNRWKCFDRIEDVLLSSTNKVNTRKGNYLHTDLIQNIYNIQIWQQ